MLDALSDAASSGSAPLHDDTGTGDAVGDRTDNRGEDELRALSDVGSRGSSRSNCIDALSDHDVDVALLDKSGAYMASTRRAVYLVGEMGCTGTTPQNDKG